MTPSSFSVEITDAVAHLRLDRPQQLNTLTPEFWRELPAVVTGISDRASARVVVLSSTGRHFSAGMDLAVFGAGLRSAGEPARAAARLRSTVRLLQEALTALERARVPVLAAVQGGAIGGALDLVTACDVRYATQDAFFVVQETALGMTADLGTLQRLGRLVPEGLARELAYTGRRLPAERAYETGLVTRLYPDHAALLEGVLATAAEIAARSPLAVWGTKVAMTARDRPVDGLEQIATWQAGMLSERDVAESLTARREGRAPLYDDLLPEPDGL